MSEDTAPDPAEVGQDHVVEGDDIRKVTPYEKRLRAEAAAFRRDRNELRTRFSELETSLKTEKERHAAEVQAARDAAAADAAKRLVQAEARHAARAAGMDVTYLDMIDLSKVAPSDAGEVVFPDGFWAAARAAHPRLFVDASSSSPRAAQTASRPGSQGATAPKHARDMTDAEFATELARLTTR